MNINININGPNMLHFVGGEFNYVDNVKPFDLCRSLRPILFI